MNHLRLLIVILLSLVGTAACSSSSDTNSPGGTGSGTNSGSGAGNQSGSDNGSKGGGGGSSGFDAFFPFTLNDGTGGATADGTGGGSASVDAPAADAAPARMCLAALGDAPGGYDWNTCCPYEAATAQDWCNHYMTFCKFNYPETNAALSPGSLPLTSMADCLARYPPLTIKSRACRSNFLCEDMGLGQPTAKSCDFADLNRRKCDGA